jgi:hypothetical protein
LIVPDEENTGQHIKTLKPNESHDKGCVTKHVGSFRKNRCSYRYNGYEHMKGSHEEIYHVDFKGSVANYKRLPPDLPDEYMLGKAGGKALATNLRTANDPRVEKEAWWFTKDCNFKTAYLPYNHNYHHILPFASLKQLEYEELIILQEAEYNLNDKWNMIILPCLDTYGFAMQLPAHPYGHTEYNKAVKKIVTKIKQTVSEKAEGHQLTPENITKFKDDIVTWQKKQFDKLVEFGKELTPELNKNQIDMAPMAAHAAGS